MSPQRETTFDVRIWATEVYQGKKVTTHRVIWTVDGKRWKQGHRTKAAADSFRSSLMTAVRNGGAFDVATGRPVSATPPRVVSRTWFDLACEYADEKWPVTSPHHRKGTAVVLADVTTALLADVMPADVEVARDIRSALANWAFTSRRGVEGQPDSISEHLAWVSRNGPDLAVFDDPRRVRTLLRLLGTKLDGSRASARTSAWRRSVLSTALTYAVEVGALSANPLVGLRVAQQRTTAAIDRRCVVNPSQARKLLDAVRETPRSGNRLVAFFGCLYYAALRPEEAVNLRRHNLELPEGGWGWITLEGAAPEVDAHWADSGQRREARELKHRSVGETRRVPCSPQLSRLLKDHLDTFGTDAEGRLFCGLKGEPISGVTYRRLWQRARERAFTAEQAASPLAARPYDLRHAAVSTWLNGGVAPTQVAEWAGHSVAVLLKVYAKCLDGETDASLRKIEASLR